TPALGAHTFRTLPLHDALPISGPGSPAPAAGAAPPRPATPAADAASASAAGSRSTSAAAASTAAAPAAALPVPVLSRLWAKERRVGALTLQEASRGVGPCLSAGAAGSPGFRRFCG